MRQFTNILLVLSLIIGVGGRFWGAWVNNESNDNHVEVVQRILANQTIAHRDDCWECFQPPAFYKFHVGLSKITGAESRRALIQQMQLVNAFLTLLSIFIILLLVRRLYGWNNLTKWAICFLLINPALFAMGIQGTNDTPIIFLGTLSMFSLVKYLNDDQHKWLIVMGLSGFLAALIKGSGLAIFLMFSTWLIVFAIKNKRWLSLSIPIVSALILAFFSHYTHNYKTYGNPFQTNLNKASPPPFFDDGKDFYARPGISSIWNSFFHFRIGNMLAQPYNINGGDVYPKHRTSFWSQMYGSFYDIQFLQHPYSWESKHPDRLNLVRIIFILGLLTIIPLMIGVIISFKHLTNPFHFKSAYFLDFVSMSLFIGMLFFGLKYAYDYRDFGCIKAIFILPVIVPMLLLFVKGWQIIKSHLFKKVAKIIFGLLILLLMVDILFLVTKLTRIAYGFITIV